jgi:hypothetical protein
MSLLRVGIKRALTFGVLAAALANAAYGCSYGAMTETIGIEEQRDYSGIATPGSGIPQHPNLHERQTWGQAMSYAALGYENASADVVALFDFADPAVVAPPSIEAQSPLQFFGTPHTDEEGVGHSTTSARASDATTTPRRVRRTSWVRTAATRRSLPRTWRTPPCRAADGRA